VFQIDSSEMKFVTESSRSSIIWLAVDLFIFFLAVSLSSSQSFDVGEHDQKVAMAKELGSKVLRCVRDQFANHVVQKCVECLPSKDIHSILRSFYGRAKALSTHPFGCHVIQVFARSHCTYPCVVVVQFVSVSSDSSKLDESHQKVLARCKDHEIYHALTAEIMENVNKLAADRFGNYVVQQLVEHGGGAMRSAMVRRFAGRVVGMSYHKFASNVVEKCLAFGSQEDRRLIADEIVAGGGGGQQQHLDHLVVSTWWLALHAL
jgi:pumilio RNA-binding family